MAYQITLERSVIASVRKKIQSIVQIEKVSLGEKSIFLSTLKYGDFSEVILFTVPILFTNILLPGTFFFALDHCHNFPPH